MLDKARAWAWAWAWTLACAYAWARPGLGPGLVLKPSVRIHNVFTLKAKHRKLITNWGQLVLNN